METRHGGREGKVCRERTYPPGGLSDRPAPLFRPDEVGDIGGLRADSK